MITACTDTTRTGYRLRKSHATIFCNMLVLLIMSASSSQAQVSDVSDSLWSIVRPSASAIDIDMGKVVVNDIRDSVVTGFLSNTGRVVISIDAISISGGDAAMFDIVSGLPPFELAPAESKEVEFRFSPTSIGVKTASVVVRTQIG